MPFAIKCACGKVFNVKDEFRGRTVRCQVCGADFIAESHAAPPPSPPPDPISIPVAMPVAGRACPFCAEIIPAAATVCPFCKEVFAEVVSTQETEALLAEAVTRLEEYVRDPGNLAADRKERGGFISVRSIVAAGFCALSIVGIVSGAMMRRDDGIGLIVMGVIMALVAVPCLIGALVNDWRAAHIQDAPNAVKAFQRYFMTCRTKRYRKAFVSLAPTARNNALVHPPKFDKIPQDTTPITVSDRTSFIKSCRAIFKGSGGHVRSVTLKNITVDKELPGDKVWVRAEAHFSSYSQYLILLILLNLIICAIAIAIATKREVKIVKKLLIKREGRWYIAQADFEGVLDRF